MKFPQSKAVTSHGFVLVAFADNLRFREAHELVPQESILLGRVQTCRLPIGDGVSSPTPDLAMRRILHGWVDFTMLEAPMLTFFQQLQQEWGTLGLLAAFTRVGDADMAIQDSTEEYLIAQALIDSTPVNHVHLRVVRSAVCHHVKPIYTEAFTNLSATGSFGVYDRVHFTVRGVEPFKQTHLPSTF